MDTKNLNVERLHQSELEKVNGGFIGAACAVIGAVLLVAGALGYADGKAACPPPPCEVQ